MFQAACHVRMPTELRTRLEAAAAREQRPVSQLARIILQRGLEQREALQQARAENAP